MTKMTWTLFLAFLKLPDRFSVLALSILLQGDSDAKSESLGDTDPSRIECIERIEQFILKSTIVLP